MSIASPPVEPRRIRSGQIRSGCRRATMPLCPPTKPRTRNNPARSRESAPMYTTSSAVLEAVDEAVIECLFASVGSAHTGLIEAIATARERVRRITRVITVPVEMVTLSAAHGHAQFSGRPQAVLVHVECGTQSLAGAIHNA